MYIGTLPCEQTGGGPLQMYRHFIESQDFEFEAIIEPYAETIEYIKTYYQPFDNLLERISKTRLYPDFVALNVLMAEHRASSSLLDKVLTFNPKAIVTIAYGSYGFVASSVARQLKLPLITFFHDWWPDLTPCRSWRKQLLDYRFRRLYQESNLALCVCDSMRNELGFHRNSEVLYPIPSFHSPEVSDPKGTLQKKPLRVVYLGLLANDYGQVVQSLVKFLQDHPQDWLDLRLYGLATDWSDNILEFAQKNSLYRGRAKYGPEGQTVLADADAYLVVTSFNKLLKRRVQTSFPSKILEYSAYGKPIIAWGPKDCSAVNFLQEHSAGSIVTSPDPADLIKCLSQLNDDIDYQIYLSQAAKELSKSLFNPLVIHNQLLKSIDQLVTFTAQTEKCQL